MTVEELYDYYGSKWTNVIKALDIGSNTIYKWRKRGYIPIASQMKIEKKTGGLFKAKTLDAQC